MEVTVKRSMPELTRRLKSNPGDETALYAVFRAVRDGGLVPELVAMLELWLEAEQGDRVPDRTLAELYFRIAKRSTEVHALELCRTALDLCPSHAAALSLFEELSDDSWADELCARYQAFLEDAPLHAASPRIRAAMIEKLVDAGSYEAALEHVSLLPKGGCVSTAPAPSTLEGNLQPS